ncbi:hypothetical protein EN807_31620, partial [Mesorhizobium sp. M5C.F.Ca.ET.164.01.1.1]
MAVEWTITIEGRNEFGDVCRKAVRIDKSWERLFDGDLGLSIEDSKTIMAALQSAVVNHEAETYPLSSGLPGLPQVTAGQGLHDATDPDCLWHRGGAQSSLDAVSGLLPRHGRCLCAAA